MFSRVRVSLCLCVQGCVGGSLGVCLCCVVVLWCVSVLSAKEERHLTLTRNRKSLHVISSIVE